MLSTNCKYLTTWVHGFAVIWKWVALTDYVYRHLDQGGLALLFLLNLTAVFDMLAMTFWLVTLPILEYMGLPCSG